MSHDKIGFLIVTIAILAISLPILGLVHRTASESKKQNHSNAHQTSQDNRKSAAQHPPPKPIGTIEHFIDAIAGNIDRRPNSEGKLSDIIIRASRTL